MYGERSKYSGTNMKPNEHRDFTSVGTFSLKSSELKSKFSHWKN